MNPPSKVVQHEDECPVHRLSKVQAVLEEMFSDSHLAEDGFLLKHVQKNEQGFVSLKLLASMKKMKALTTDWQLTGIAAVYSDLLHLNSDLTKVRRVQPLPQWLLSSPTSRLLLVSNITEKQIRGRQCAELSFQMLQKFNVYGDVSTVWILHPGEELPKQLQCYAKRHSMLGQCLCAVVRFIKLEGVRNALNALRVREEKSSGTGMCVVPLGFQKKKKFCSSEDLNNNQFGDGTFSQEGLNQQELSSPDEVSDAPLETHQGPFNCTSTHCSMGSNSTYSSTNHSAGDSGKEISESPWVRRRKSEAATVKSQMSKHLQAPLQRVIRQPVGPDGTRGFRGRGKPLHIELKLSLMKQH